ncbi:glycosyltransferase family 2 protein [Bacteroides sp. GD17]|jgi:hypothetical protein|uniref:glycosyltransferase family 2 protein n=1 Tax=Bacteroides sp. GD17 TaxID=3139826 RepID=UPI00313C65D1
MRSDVPIVVFFFLRIEKTKKIISQLSSVAPKKIYLISDGGRSEKEKEIVADCRRQVEDIITWPCTVVKNYADKNEGVYNRIALGAKWVFSQEPMAIFLEDDNLPEISFFQFCEELLDKYKDDSRILWICGTNYLINYEPKDGSSYLFTHNMLPCGWASWSDKFNKYYDGFLELWADKYIRKEIESKYDNKVLLKQDIKRWDMELDRLRRGQRFNSWDAQMAFSIRVHGLYGIVPKYNQIRNIGVDLNSVHGGISLDNIMTKRFCELKTIPMEFPLKHPKVVMIDRAFESKISNIITLPLIYRMKAKLNVIAKMIFFVGSNDSFVKTMKSRMNRLLSKGRT